jgi:hypothetical protein
MSCPVIGTTNDVLPPNHPDIDMSKDGQTVRTPQSPLHSHTNETSTVPRRRCNNRPPPQPHLAPARPRRFLHRDTVPHSQVQRQRARSPEDGRRALPCSRHRYNRPPTRPPRYAQGQLRRRVPSNKGDGRASFEQGSHPSER